MTSIAWVDDDVMADITGMRRARWYGRSLRFTVGKCRMSFGYTRKRRSDDPVSGLRDNAFRAEILRRSLAGEKWERVDS